MKFLNEMYCQWKCEHKKTNSLSIFELRFRSRIQHGIEIMEMKINVNSLSSRRLHYRLPRGFVTFLESKTQDEETQVRLNAKFLGMDQITSKNCIESSRMQVNKILLTRDRPEGTPGTEKHKDK